MDTIVLIGGSPTVGKSYTARKIAEELKLPWISTDTIREQMRKLVERKNYPKLFMHAGATSNIAFEYLTNNRPQKIVEDQNDESIEVWKGVKALIEGDYVWKSFIVEGVAVLPSLVSRLPKKGRRIKAVFLIDENESRIRKTIYARGLWDDAKKYPNSVKEKEVEWVLAFNDYIKKEAKKHNFPVIDVGNRKRYIDEIKKHIL